MENQNTENQKTSERSAFNAFMRKMFAIVKLEKLYDKYEEAILYVFFGALTTLISIITKFLGFAVIPDKDQLWRNAVVVAFSWICSVTFAFFTNKKYVFNNKTSGKSEFVKVLVSFYGARLATFLMEYLMFFICCDLLDINENIITVISQFVIFAANYILSKLFVFRKKEKNEKE